MVRFLLDHNLSPRLTRQLSDLFPGSIHVSEIGLQEADDMVIWEYAKANGLAILTKDSDFSDRSLLYGAPPKIVRLHLGNCSTAAVEALLRNQQEAIAAFQSNRAKACLHLPESGWTS